MGVKVMHPSGEVTSHSSFPSLSDLMITREKLSNNEPLNDIDRSNLERIGIRVRKPDTATTKIKPIFTVSQWYPKANFPFGRPTLKRKECYVRAIKTKPFDDSKDTVQLPVSSWTITVYDDLPHEFRVSEARGLPGSTFTVRSKAAALRGIRSRCTDTGEVLRGR